MPSNPVRRSPIQLAAIARWLGAAALIRVEVFALAALDLPPVWRGRVFGLLVARTFLLLLEWATPPVSTSPRMADRVVLPAMHLAALALAVLAAIQFGPDTTVALALLLVAGLFWLVMTTPLSRWRATPQTSLAFIAAAAGVGVAATGATPVVKQLWTGIEDVPAAGSLGAWTLHTSYLLLHLLEPTATMQESSLSIGARGFEVTVAPSCAGVSGMALVAIFLAAYFAIFRQSLRFPRAFLLLPLGLAIIWTFNVIRITTLVLIGAHGWPDVAVNGFHSRAGWLAFNGVAIGLAALGRTSPFLITETAETAEPAEAANPTAPFLMPLLGVLATSLLTEAMSSGFDRLYGLRVLVVAAIAWRYRDTYAGLRWRLSGAAVVGGAVVFVLWVALARLGAPVPDKIGPGLALLPRHLAVLWMVFRILGSVLVAPFSEELSFRAWLPRRLQRRYFEDVPLGAFTTMSVLVSSVAFGALHGMWLAGTFAGLIYAWVLSHRKSIGDAVAAHALTNGMLCVYALASGDWSLL